MKIQVYMKEIQYRLFFTCSSFIFNAFTIYLFKEQLVFLLGQHQNSDFPHFIATNLPEVFLCFVKLSVFLGFYFSFPVILLQLWFFIRPALYKYEHKIAQNFLALSICLFLFNTFSVYKILLPYCWKFFSAFELNYENSGVNLQLETRLNEYLNFVTQLLYSLIIITNFCIFLSFFLFKFPIGSLIKLRKTVYFLCFILSTIITPPDILSQIFVGVILIFFFELFMFSLFLTHEYKRANNGI